MDFDDFLDLVAIMSNRVSLTYHFIPERSIDQVMAIMSNRVSLTYHFIP